MSFNFKNYLEEELYKCQADLGFKYKIVVSKERAIRESDKGTILFIFKNLTGSYLFDNVHIQPVQIVCYSELNTMQAAQQILELFAKRHNNESFNSGDTLIKQNFDSPVALRTMIESANNFKASLYLYGTYTEFDNLADIKVLEWLNDETYEKINYLTASIGYSAVLNTTKESGIELSTSMKQESTLVLTISMMNENNSFCKLINKIMHGVVSGNTAIKFKYTLNNETYINDFKLSNCSLSVSTTESPGLNLTFTL